MSHNHTFRHAGSYKYRMALTFVKAGGEEGQNGRLKCPLGFLVLAWLRSITDIKDLIYIDLARPKIGAPHLFFMLVGP